MSPTASAVSKNCNGCSCSQVEKLYYSYCLFLRSYKDNKTIMTKYRELKGKNYNIKVLEDYVMRKSNPLNCDHLLKKYYDEKCYIEDEKTANHTCRDVPDTDC